MSGPSFYIKQGDTSPAILVSLLPSDTDITGAAGVVFNMRLRGTTTPVIDRKAATIVAATGPAQLNYSWASGDTDVAGEYEAEFEVTRADGSVETFPNDSYIDIVIRPEIG